MSGTVEIGSEELCWGNDSRVWRGGHGFETLKKRKKPETFFESFLRNDDKLRKKERTRYYIIRKRSRERNWILGKWFSFSKGLAERYKWPNLKKSKKSSAENKRKEKETS